MVLRNYHHIRTVTSQYSLWVSNERGILGNTLPNSYLWYSWWFVHTSTFLFSNMCLRLFNCSVLRETMVRGRFINTSSVFWSCWPEWRGPTYQCNFSVSRYFHHIRAVTSHCNLWCSREHGVLGTMLLILCFLYYLLFFRMSTFELSNLCLVIHIFSLILYFSGVLVDTDCNLSTDFL